MATKITRKVVATRVKGFKVGTDGQPEAFEITLPRTFRSEKAAENAAVKQAGCKCMITSVERVTDTYSMTVEAFMQNATKEAAAEGDTAEGDE